MPPRPATSQQTRLIIGPYRLRVLGVPLSPGAIVWPQMVVFYILDGGPHSVRTTTMAQERNWGRQNQGGRSLTPSGWLTNPDLKDLGVFVN